MFPKRKRGVLAFGPISGAGLALCMLLSLQALGCSEESQKSSVVVGGSESSEVPAQVAWQAFEGRTLWAGREVQARLRPLQPSPERMEFDTRAWKLDSGQILWSLQLSLEGPKQGADDIQPDSDLVVIKGLAVGHAGGPALRFLDVREVPRVNGVYDPLQVLLTAPSTQLVGGQPFSMVLAGPAAISAPKLVGLPFELELLPEVHATAHQPTEIPILDYTTQIKQ
ncbi:MAG: hypothetical protein ACI87O_000318 [Planctomycetota bacterium]|jgi:hypothetical protein